MDPVLYRSAMEGEVDVLIEHIKVLEEERKDIHHELTPYHNTILHVAVQFGHVHIVKGVLQKLPTLVLRQNKKQETPLHMAARKGQADIVEELIRGAQNWDGGKVEEMLRIKNVEGDTALHMAARNCHLKEDDKYLEVVTLLAKADPEFKHHPNNNNETPLYLAAERGNKGVKVMFALLERYKSISYNGPGDRTALHAVALKDFSIGQQTIQELLKRQKDLMNRSDKNGWTPLHYAACSGNIPVMDEFLKHCPDCWEKVDKMGRNILHIAVEKNFSKVIDHIAKQPWGGHLINQKNNEGDTPLHLLVDSDYYVDELWKHPEADRHVFNGKDMTPIDLMWSNVVDKSKSTFADTVDDTFLDPENEGGRNIASKAHDQLAILKRLSEENKRKEKAMEEAQVKEKRAREEAQEKEKRESEEVQEREKRTSLEAKQKEERKQIEERKASMTVYQSLVLVAALIATISSAAAFVIPGGYDGNQGRDQGMAVLARAAAFKAFIITNTIALSSSVTSILLCLNALYYYSINKPDIDITRRYAAAGLLILVAIFSLMLAFITAGFAVLAHSIALAVSTCIIAFIIACIGFIVFFLDLGKFVYLLRHSPPKPQATNNGNEEQQSVNMA